MNEFLKEIIKSIGDLNILLCVGSLFFICMSVIINPKKISERIDEILGVFATGVLIVISGGITYLFNNNSLEYILLCIMIYSAVKSIDYFICAISYRIAKNIELKILNK